MFNHSIKVPRLYKNASKIAREVSEGKGSIKQLVYASGHSNIKGLYALVVTTFQKTDEIEILLKKSKLLIKEPKFDPWLAKILIVEILWGKKRLTGESKPIKTILAYEQILRAHMSDVSENFEDIKQVEKPRYVRVNTLKTTINEAIEGFRNEGWVLKRHTENDYLGFLDAVTNLGSEEFMMDIHIPNLLIFPPRTQFYEHIAYKNGSIILQDKASCLPVHLLNPERGSTILDMCAAPGMKTTQTAALIENDGVIYAAEIGIKRFQVLTQIVESAGATCVKPINRDVTTLTDSDCPGVEYILVDPSCSGSGITDRIEIGQQKWDEHHERLQKLAAFQITTLRYALTKFPKAKRVVYSTCSVYPEENEDVVRQVLETCTKFKLVPAGDFINNTWLNYGSSDFGDIGKYCLYAKPDIDLTSGFFVAVFERLEKGERNQFLNSNMYSYTKTMEKKKNKRLGQESEVAKNEGMSFNIKKEDTSEEKNGPIEDQNQVISKKKKKKCKSEIEIENIKAGDIKLEEKETQETANDIADDALLKIRRKKEKKKHKEDIVKEGTSNVVKKEDIADYAPVKIKREKKQEEEESYVVKKKKKNKEQEAENASQKIKRKKGKELNLEEDQRDETNKKTKNKKIGEPQGTEIEGDMPEKKKRKKEKLKEEHTLDEDQSDVIKRKKKKKSKEDIETEEKDPPLKIKRKKKQKELE